jgi:hypothetical protein
MTLSYRWGISPKTTLLKSNVEEFREGKFIRDLPKTFQEAIAISRKFGIMYLWIDSLCIIQDCQEDWEKEGAQMDLVYTHSACNIAASASNDPSGGLFRTREARDILPGKVMAKIANLNLQPYFIHDSGYWDRHVSDQPLHRRGWVLQERLLAPRVLYFSERQVLWECFTEHKCEGFPLGVPLIHQKERFDHLFTLFSGQDDLLKQQKNSIYTFNRWSNIVSMYTRCDLTFPMDKLVAISGVVKFFRSATGDDFLAGLWRSHLPAALNWKVVTPAITQPPSYRAPSWSWACLDTPVDPPMALEYARQFISVLDVQVKSPTPNCAQLTTRGRLVVKAPAFGAVSTETYNNKKNAYVLLADFGKELIIPFMPDASYTYPDMESKVLCIVLSASWTMEIPHWVRKSFSLDGIVLRESHNESDTYVRVGHFRIIEENVTANLGFTGDKKDGSIELGEGLPLTTVTIL